MVENLSVTEKLGCDENSLDDCILIKASIEEVSTVVEQYFGLEVRSHCQIVDYIDVEASEEAELERRRQIQKSRPNKLFPPLIWGHPCWRYLEHQWTILPPPKGWSESIAFAFALLLNTDVITFYDSDHAVHKEFKVFRQDKLVEHYLFGSECGTDLNNDWDVKLEGSESDYWKCYEHRFKSSIRQVREAEIRLAFQASDRDRGYRGFLDACLRHHQAYIPVVQETPGWHSHCRSYSNLFQNWIQEWDSVVERMDIIFVPSDWRYFDLNIPKRLSSV